MQSKILQILMNNFLTKKIINLGYLPRWIIFMIDLIIVLLSSLITFFIISGLTVTFYNHLNVAARLAIIIIVNGLFFVFFKTHSGIIRHSTFIDGVKLLYATSCSFMFLLFFNYVYYFYFNQKIYLSTSLFVGYVVSFLLLFLFRILVKYLFEIYASNLSNLDLLNIVIYGSDANAISVANALKTENPARFKLVGFINKQKTDNTSKRILNLPIINHNKSLASILKSFNSNVLIIAEKDLTKSERIPIVEECLENEIKVFTVPVITNWTDSKQISKKVTNFQIEDLLNRKPIELDKNKISNQLKGKTILITGAAGSIGSEITRQVFLFQPKKIIILDQAETPLHNLRLEINNISKNVKIRSVLTDIRNLEALEKVFLNYKPDVVYHAAAYKHVPLMEENPSQAIYTNVIGTKNLADVSIKYKVGRFVMVSTDKAVNPSSVMGASKRIAEKYVQTLHHKYLKEGDISSTKFITTRFGNVLGSNGSIVPLFAKQIQEGGPITITHPEIIRYFMTIPEACQLVLEAGTMGKGGEIFIFDMGQQVKIIDLAKKMIRLAGFIPDKEIEIKIIGLRPGEKLYEELLNDTSKTLPTHNEKILIAQEIQDNYDKIQKATIDLIEHIADISNEQIVIKMKKIVPEFKSMNSIFETLDI